jgi:hypothetical protein
MDMLVTFANMLYIVAYFTTNILRLRLLTVSAAVCLAVYFYSRPVPMLNVVGWNVFFIALNLFQIARIVKRRRVEFDAKPSPGAPNRP